MGTRKVEQGPTGQCVAASIREVRGARQMSLADLSAKLSEVGRPILPSGLSKIETGERRVDVDDLVALALALNVSPLALLLPRQGEPRDDIKLTPKMTVMLDGAWTWGTGAYPADTSMLWEGWKNAARQPGGWAAMVRAFQSLSRPRFEADRLTRVRAYRTLIDIRMWLDGYLMSREYLEDRERFLSTPHVELSAADRRADRKHVKELHLSMSKTKDRTERLAERLLTELREIDDDLDRVPE